jgi:hypothetical protein
MGARLVNPGRLDHKDDRLGTATPPTLRFRGWPIGKVRRVGRLQLAGDSDD